MIIRQEQKADEQVVYNIIKEAFACAEHRDGNEQDLVVALRNSEAFIKELSLVAEVDGTIVGHILFTKVMVDGKAALALAPLAVLPKYQRQGIGLSLIKEGHRIGKELGYSCSIVLGHAEYYKKAGYRPASQYGIYPPFDVPDENFMAYFLSEERKDIQGTVLYAPEFGIDG